MTLEGEAGEGGSINGDSEYVGTVSKARDVARGRVGGSDCRVEASLKTGRQTKAKSNGELQ